MMKVIVTTTALWIITLFSLTMNMKFRPKQCTSWTNTFAAWTNTFFNWTNTYIRAVNNPAGSRSMQYFTLLSPTMTLASQLCLAARRATCWLIHHKSVQNPIFTFISASVLRLIYLTFDRLWACLLLSWPRKQLLVHQLGFLRPTHKSIAAKCCKLAIWCFYRHHSLWVWLSGVEVCLVTLYISCSGCLWIDPGSSWSVIGHCHWSQTSVQKENSNTMQSVNLIASS